MRWLSRVICSHKWHLLDERFEIEIDFFGISERKTYCYIYCPKCDKEDKVDFLRWDLIQKMQKIKEKYNENN